MKHREELPASIVMSALILLSASTASAESTRPPEFDGVAISGRALDAVRGKIDLSKPLGTCSDRITASHLRIILPNVRSSRGDIRVSLYSGNKDEWMKKGAKLLRFDVPARAGRMEICMPLPYGPGTYALGLYHDEDGNKSYGVFSEGYGFSNNASGTFGPPKFKKAVFTAQGPETRLDIRIRY